MYPLIDSIGLFGDSTQTGVKQPCQMAVKEGGDGNVTAVMSLWVLCGK